jgi:hypothetical protein
MMPEALFVTDFGATIINPKMLCPVHGEVDSWVSYQVGNSQSPMYCIRCAWEIFEKLGISIITPIEPKAR